MSTQPPIVFGPAQPIVTPPGTQLGPITVPGTPQAPYVPPPPMIWPFELPTKPIVRPAFQAALDVADRNAILAHDLAIAADARHEQLLAMLQGDVAKGPEGQPSNLSKVQTAETLAAMYVQQLFSVAAAISDWRRNARRREALGLKTLDVPTLPAPPDFTV